MNILITGSCGFVGSSLVPYLLNKGHHIKSFDTEWFGKNLPDHSNLEHQKKDIRNLEYADFHGIDSIIHLANIANDPGVELNTDLSWEVNVLASQQLAELAAKANVKTFIYASSGSVYGVKEEEHTFDTFHEALAFMQRLLPPKAGEATLPKSPPESTDIKSLGC